MKDCLPPACLRACACRCGDVLADFDAELEEDGLAQLLRDAAGTKAKDASLFLRVGGARALPSRHTPTLRACMRVHVMIAIATACAGGTSGEVWVCANSRIDPRPQS